MAKLSSPIDSTGWSAISFLLALCFILPVFSLFYFCLLCVRFCLISFLFWMCSLCSILLLFACSLYLHSCLFFCLSGPLGVCCCVLAIFACLFAHCLYPWFCLSVCQSLVPNYPSPATRTHTYTHRRRPQTGASSRDRRSCARMPAVFCHVFRDGAANWAVHKNEWPHAMMAEHILGPPLSSSLGVPVLVFRNIW